jgi:PAS domain S-box-containing protein
MGKAHTRAFVLLTSVLACCACACALDPSLEVSQYAHTAWTIRDGFFKGNIYAIAQGQDGYLWLGTEFGLLRFDGNRSILWQPPAGQNLPANGITSLLASSDGTLWIGTYAGLVSWNGARLTRYPELDNQLVTALLQDHAGTVWAGSLGSSSGRLCAVGNGTAHCYGEDGTFGRTVLSMFEDRSGSLWVGAQTGLWRWKPGLPTHYAMPGTELNGLNASDGGEPLIAMPGGMRQLVHGKPELYPKRGAKPINANRLLQDHDGGLWIGTLDRGLIHVHHGRTDIFSKSDGLSGDVIFSLFEDREGNIWVSTNGGLDRFRDVSVSTISLKQGLSSDTAWSVLAGRDGSVWIGTGDGLNKWSKGQISTIHNESGRLDDAPQSLFQDEHDRIWAFTGHGLAYVENGRFVPVSGVHGTKVHFIAGDKAGNLWLSETSNLLHIRDGRLAEQIPWSRLGRMESASVMLSDPEHGGLWLGFWRGGGVLYFKDGQVRASYTSANGLSPGAVTDLRLDQDGALWVATQGVLDRIKDGRITTLTDRNGLPCDTVLWTMDDDDHSLWLYTACGLVRIARTQVDAWIADPQRKIQTTVFDATDGVRLRSTAPSGYGPRVTRASDGRLWFVTGEGVQVLDPRHISFNKLPPPVHIEQIVADHRILWQNLWNDSSSNLRLPRLTHDLEIDYAALSLVAPEKVRFKYKLDGYDGDWQDVGNRRQAFYTNLSPASYRFRVIACNNSGVWNDVGASLEFSIAPAYYQTNWFRALCAIAILALIWAAYLLRVRQLRQQERALRDVVETIPTFAWTAQPDGSIDFANRHWEEYSGLSPEKTLGSGWLETVHPEDSKRHVEKWLASVRNGKSFENEVRFRRADGEYRWFLVRAVPMQDRHRNISRWYGTSTDIEDRKRVEQLQSDLAHMNRVTTLGELTASLAHEIKQPISATILNANTCLRWLNREKPDLDEAREAANRIAEDGNRAAEIIDRLRSLYKKAPPKRELANVNEIVEEMVVLMRGEANQNAVSIRTDLSAIVPRITADRVQLQQVLMNLMLNGIEAMKETGGILTIKSQLSQDGSVLISVTDTGPGLPAENADQIFNAFFTTKPQGSGMGLAICRSIIEAHGGHLWATANNGRGAAFHFTLSARPDQEKVPSAGS